jgi:hypothetical protein
MLRLFGTLPDYVSLSRTDASGRPRDDGGAEFIAGNGESCFSVGSVPIRERTALNVGGNSLICIAHRVRTEVGKASMHDGLVFLRTSCLSIIGCEFGKIRPGDDDRNMAVRVIHYLSLWIGTIKIGLLAVLLKRDGNERPCSHEVLGRRLRGRIA